MFPLNTQPAEKQILRDDGKLDVIEVFPTIQGEGPFAGTPAIFVRLAGCNLVCPKCDTQYTEGRNLVSIHDLREQVKALAGDKRQRELVVLTGGEPFRQNFLPFVTSLIKSKFWVQVETNGTLFLHGLQISDGLSIICSPKTPNIDERLARIADAFKYVVRAGEISEEDGLPLKTLGNNCGVARPPKEHNTAAEVYVQPLDEGDEEANKRNMEAAVSSCMKHGYLLSIQTHKIAGLP